MLPDTSAPGNCDPEDLDVFLAHFVRGTEAVHELRALRVPDGRRTVTLAGYFDLATDTGQESLRREVARLSVLAADRAPRGIYITANPVRRELLARAPDKLRVASAGECAADGDVIERRWLVVDTDPQRAANTSATDAEKREARRVTDAVLADLKSRGWPKPIECDSGNGFHLWYPADGASDSDVKALLRALAKKHNTTGAHIDTSLFNPSRIVKLPGTWARKGSDTPERPHRRATVLTLPEW